MYLKSILILFINCTLYILLLGQNFTYQPVPSLVPLSLCDKRYSIEMDKALVAFRDIGNSSARSNLIKDAEEYMILVKHQQDLDVNIRAIEARIFNLDAIHVLRRPLANYINCKDQSARGAADNGMYARSFEVNSKVPTLTRLGYPLFVAVGHCDNLYAILMEQALENIKSILTVDLIKVAEEYMVLVKQQQDADARIREMELRVFSLSTLNILRRPVQQYVKCADSLRTGTYSRNFYR